MSLRPGLRTIVLVVVAIVSCGVLSACGAGTDASRPGPLPPLRILLVNDGGWNEPGTVVLREALQRAGHAVVQVSPALDSSRGGTATTVGPIQVRLASGAPDVWTTSGTAADATTVGLAGVMGSPNLVIAGISRSFTASMAAFHSGTLGAALTAAARRVPAIAVGTDANAATRPADYVRLSDFIVRVVGALQRQPPGPLLPEHTVLNVNYPQGPVNGVASAPMSVTPASTISYQYTGTPGLLVATDTPALAANSDDDYGKLAQRFVTLSDVTADPDRTAPPARVAARLAPVLAP